ncbi:MAG: intracellular protease, PfpI family [Myxococcaceae bacterium]|nr:intracellular protease, PfpI family [Myxococcaceae bacterium]
MQPLCAEDIMAKIAFLLGPDFEDSEFRVPYDRLLAKGHQLTVLGAKAGETVQGKKGKESVQIEGSAREHRASDYAAVVIPGGYSPDHLRTDEGVVGFVRDAARANKPIAAVCHGPSLLIEAELVRGKTVTSWPSIRTDLKNAGATVVDKQVVSDGGLITSRKPDDLEAFTEAILKAIG